MAFAEQIFWVYPWDLSDTNPADRLEELRRLGADTISIPFAYHSVRALAPHRQGNKVVSAGAALGFRPRPGEFPPSGLQPPVQPWATDQGPVENLAFHAEKAGLRIKAWTVVFHSTPLASTNPDSAITNCFGDRFAHALCPSAPKSREYALRLVRAVSARPVHAVELEAAGFYGYEHFSHHDKCGVCFDQFHHFLFSYCFCPHCTKAIGSTGLDPGFVSDRFRRRLTAFFDGTVPRLSRASLASEELESLLGESVAATLLGERSRSVLSLLREIRETIPRDLELTLCCGLSPFEGGASFGAEPGQAARSAERLLLVGFEPGEAAFRGRFEQALHCLGDCSRWIAGVRIFPPDTASEEAIRSRLAFLQEKGFRAVQLYHYGLAPTHLLAAAARALEKTKGESGAGKN